jgi:hypothetical protein
MNRKLDLKHQFSSGMLYLPQKLFFLLILSLGVLISTRSMVIGAEIVGKVVDSRTGLGISGALLRAIPQQGKNREIRGRTDTEGKYHLELLRGSYLLHVNVPDSVYWPRFYSASGLEKGDVLQVPSFDSYLDLDIPVQAGGSISGIVLRQKDGRPLSNVHVYAESGETRVSTFTHSNGSYFLRPLLPGDYRIHIMTLNENYIPEYYNDRLDARKAELLPIHDREEILGIDFRLELGGVIRGRVTSRNSHLPLMGAKIVAEKIKSQEPLRYLASDRQGYYALQGLTPGKYLLECSLRQETEEEANSGKNYLLQYFQATLDRSQAKPLEVQPESINSEVNFELVEESRISGQTWSQYQKAPVKNVTIRPWLEQTEPLYLAGGESDNKGYYRIDNLPPGKYRLETILSKSNQKFVPMFYQKSLNYDQADVLDVPEGSWLHSIDFSLSLGANIRGQIRTDDSSYKLESESVLLHLKPEGLDIFQYGEHEFKTQADGSFLIQGIPAGRYQIFPVLKDPNLLPEPEVHARILSLVEGETQEGVEFNLRIGGSLSGSVISQDSRYPPEKLAIILISVKEQTQRVFQLKSEQYLLTGLSPGLYAIILTTTPQEMLPDRPIPASRVFDSRYVDISKGAASKGVDFLIKSSPAGLLNSSP